MLISASILDFWLVQFPNSNHMQYLLIRACNLIAHSWNVCLALKFSMHIRLSAKHTSLLVYYSILVDYLPQSCRLWIQQPTARSNNSGCILISIQRVSTWTPEAISPILNTTHLPVQCKPSSMSNITVSPVLSLCQVHMLLQSVLQYVLLQVWKNTVFSVPSAGIPLDIDNSNGRTFPYLGQSDYR